jgi:hypothetical protein
MGLVEEISFFLGLLVSCLFFREYARVEKMDEREETLEQLLR